MSVTAMRPGSALGPYPEREDLRLGALDRAAAKVSALWVASGRGAGAGFAKSAPELEAQTRRFAAMSDEALDSARQDVRVALGRGGLSAEIVPRAFALIRECAGRSLGMRHYEVQCMGGWVMLNGMLAEMQTGQGKTLTATLPACTAALAGIPVHVVTANDYLARATPRRWRPCTSARAERGRASPGMSGEATRRLRVRRHLLHGQAGGLRLPAGPAARAAPRGRMRLRSSALARPRRRHRLLMRGLCFAIVDEADSVLIDEARTPLILSARRAERQSASTPRRSSSRAQLEPGADFRGRRASARSSCRTRRGAASELPARAGRRLVGPRRRERAGHQALSALHLYERDEHYLVRDGKVQIIDRTPAG